VPIVSVDGKGMRRNSGVDAFVTVRWVLLCVVHVVNQMPVVAVMAAGVVGGGSGGTGSE
jgi:hypothetical protein